MFVLEDESYSLDELGDRINLYYCQLKEDVSRRNASQTKVGGLCCFFFPFV